MSDGGLQGWHGSAMTGQGNAVEAPKGPPEGSPAMLPAAVHAPAAAEPRLPEPGAARPGAGRSTAEPGLKSWEAELSSFRLQATALRLRARLYTGASKASGTARRQAWQLLLDVPLQTCVSRVRLHGQQRQALLVLQAVAGLGQCRAAGPAALLCRPLQASCSCWLCVEALQLQHSRRAR